MSGWSKCRILNKIMVKIQDKSIFGEYSKRENRVTAALLHILRIGGERLISYIFKDRFDNFPTNDIDITTQEKNDAGICDGYISCNFTFNLQIECKCDSGIDKKQLMHYREQQKADGSYLVYIVKSVNNCEKLEDVPYFTWNELYKLLKKYIVECSSNNVEKYMIDQFMLMLENYKLLEDDVIEDRVIVVGGAKGGEEIARKYHFYACQNHRTFKSARYLAFCHHKRIKYVYEIIGEPIDNVSLRDERLEVGEDYFTTHPEYQETTKLKYFRLGHSNLLNHEIEDNIKNEYGRVVPFARKQRYVSFKRILAVMTTSELLSDMAL